MREGPELVARDEPGVGAAEQAPVVQALVESLAHRGELHDGRHPVTAQSEAQVHPPGDGDHALVLHRRRLAATQVLELARRRRRRSAQLTPSGERVQVVGRLGDLPVGEQPEPAVDDCRRDIGLLEGVAERPVSERVGEVAATGEHRGQVCRVVRRVVDGVVRDDLLLTRGAGVRADEVDRHVMTRHELGDGRPRRYRKPISVCTRARNLRSSTRRPRSSRPVPTYLRQAVGSGETGVSGTTTVSAAVTALPWALGLEPTANGDLDDLAGARGEVCDEVSARECRAPHSVPEGRHRRDSRARQPQGATREQTTTSATPERAARSTAGAKPRWPRRAATQPLACRAPRHRRAMRDAQRYQRRRDRETARHLGAVRQLSAGERPGERAQSSSSRSSSSPEDVPEPSRQQAHCHSMSISKSNR